jgi:hypothetical protein
VTDRYATTTGLSTNAGTIGSPWDLATALASCANGDRILVGNGTYTQPRLLNKTNVTIQALNAPTMGARSDVPSWHPANVTPFVTFDTVRFENSPGWVIDGIEVVLKQWIDCTDGTHTDKFATTAWATKCLQSYGILSFDGGSHSGVARNCDIHWGYGPTQAPFDPTFKYPEYQSGKFTYEGGPVGWDDPPQSWWVQDSASSGIPGDGYAYNTIGNAPYAIREAVGGAVLAKPPRLINCHVHDVNKLGSFTRDYATVADRGEIDTCWVQRIYSIAIATAGGEFVHTSGFKLTRTFIGRFMGDVRDSGGAHCDVYQDFIADSAPTAGTVSRHPNMWLERIFVFAHPNDRGSPQCFFFEGARTGYPDAVYENPLLRDIMLMQGKGSALGVSLTYVEDGVVARIMNIKTPGTATGGGSKQIALGLNPTTNFAGRTLLKDCITEGIQPGAHIDSQGNVVVGLDYSVVSRTALMSGTFPPAVDTPENWFNAATRQAAYAGKGPKFATLQAFLTDPLTTADLPPYIGFRVKTLQAVSTTGAPVNATSDKSAIRGPLGDNLTVHVDKGEFQITDRTGTVISAWRSTDVAAAVGNYIQCRHNTSTAYSTTVTQTVTLTHAVLGASTFTFQSSTQSNVQMPSIHLIDGVQPTYLGAIGADTKKFTLALRCKLNAEATSLDYLFADGNQAVGPGVRIIGLDSTHNKMRLGLTTAAGADIYTVNVDSDALDTTSEYLLIWAVDTATGGLGASAAVHNLTTGGSYITFGNPSMVADALVGFSVSTGASAFKILNLFGGGTSPDVSFLFLALNKWIDPTDPLSVQKFSPAFIGHRGQGIFGTLPEIFVCGSAAEWNAAGGLNLGSNSIKFITSGGGVTVAAAHAWPPVLDLSATLLTTSTAITGQPVQFLLQATGYCDALSITPASNKAGSWDASPASMPEGSNGIILTFTPTAAGTHTISFTNNIGYNNPTSLSVPVGDSRVLIPAGTSVQLTAEEAATLTVFTSATPPATGLGPVLVRYHRGVGETGLIGGENVRIDVV